MLCKCTHFHASEILHCYWTREQHSLRRHWHWCASSSSWRHEEGVCHPSASAGQTRTHLEFGLHFLKSKRKVQRARATLQKQIRKCCTRNSCGKCSQIEETWCFTYTNRRQNLPRSYWQLCPHSTDSQRWPHHERINGLLCQAQTFISIACATGYETAKKNVLSKVKKWTIWTLRRSKVQHFKIVSVNPATSSGMSPFFGRCCGL